MEVLFTVITLLAGLAAWLGEQLGLPGVGGAALYLVAYAAGGYYGLLDGLELLRERKLDVNLLMILAAVGAAFIGQPAEGAALLFLFSLSNTLQTYAMGRSRRAIEALLDLRPKTATVRRDGEVVTLPVEELVVGDRVLVRPGERIPIDGVVVDGNSQVDQATITGESMPVAKGVGDPVFAGTVNGNGSLEIETTHRAQDTTLARIVQMVEEAQAAKANTQRMLDDFEQVYAVLVLLGAVLLTLVPVLLLGHEFQPSFYRAMTWLVVASPCALVISTPASILSAIANAARHGVLFKGGLHLEKTAAIRAVAFDKTGTLTVGKPRLQTFIPLGVWDEVDALRLIAAVEARSEHPLAQAIVGAAHERGLSLPEATDFQAFPGLGVEGRVEGMKLWIGNARMFARRGVPLPENVRSLLRELEGRGVTAMLAYRVEDADWLAVIGVADALRPDAAAVVQRLKDAGVQRVIMLTGDNERVAAAIAAQAGVDEFHAGLLPQDKVALLRSLRAKYGPTAMVGDGVNDAPALATADVGIAMGGAGTDVALETADVVLMADDLEKLPFAIGLARAARRVVWQNLVFSLAVIVLLVALAFGVRLPLPFGVLGHEGSTVLVVLNGLRLLGYRSQGFSKV
ncbi:MAG: cadmium-translocating P-type ATPase [Anaerolineae bacterium]|nr:MAG: cadmium-translocating P-type ATPase [Anaerolineae bacterium]